MDAPSKFEHAEIVLAVRNGLCPDIEGRSVVGPAGIAPPLKFNDFGELVINVKTAKALGLTIPPSLIAHAEEVVE